MIINQTALRSVFFIIVCSLITICSYSQDNFRVNGVVKDESGVAINNVSIYIKNQPGLGTTSDTSGHFSIKVSLYDILVFSHVGHVSKEIPVKDRNALSVTLSGNTKGMDEVVVVAAQKQRKVSVVGAITTVNPKTLVTPSGDLAKSLAGNVPGIIARTTSGEPGTQTEFWIRGKSTFGANSSALVLVDGIERNFSELNTEDIESMSVLKDASATAVYGQRGANGVIIITTKRGKEGKVRINFRGEAGTKMPSKMPDYADAATYANLANEANLSRGKAAKYTPEEVEIINYGLDKDLYPNVNWRDEVLKTNSPSYRGLINLSGGGSTARYFISGAYYNEQGMYQESSLSKYRTNQNYKKYNFRANTDVNLTKTTIFEFGAGGWVTSKNKPGSSSDAIWGSFAALTPITVPIRFSNGLLPAFGTNNNASPYTLLNETGYITEWENKLETNIGLKQDLSFITSGLNFYGRFAFDAYNWNTVRRLKSPDLYKAELQRDGKGNLVQRRVHDASPLTQTTDAWGDKRTYTEFNFSYEKVVNKIHRFGGLLLFYQQQYSRNNAGGDVFGAIPKRNMAFSGRVTYALLDRYFLEANAGYTGSENFEKGKRFGLFPALGAGWVISEEKFLKDNIDWLNQLKIRASYGKVGNDVLAQRFPYISTVGGAGGYSFGDLYQSGVGGIDISTIGANNLTWEVSSKYNLGFDLKLFNHFNATVDFFKDTREKIFMKRGFIPYTVGLSGNQVPWANVGKMVNKGVDGTLAYDGKLGELNYTVRGNFTYAYTRVLDFDEAANALTYQMTKGYRLGQTRGLIAMGLFEDQKEINNSPAQKFGDAPLPGDIRYKDVNGDGIINDDDIVPIGYSQIPGLIYGFGISTGYKNFSLSFLFQGSGNSDFFLGGTGVAPFAANEYGNILNQVADQKSRWTSSDISGTTETENPNAIFPRLSYGGNSNNYRNSTYWLRNARFLRLKNVEFAYTLPRRLTSKYKIESARFYFLGYDLFVLSPFKWWDPELASGNGAAYPIQKICTVGLSISL